MFSLLISKLFKYYLKTLSSCNLQWKFFLWLKWLCLLFSEINDKWFQKTLLFLRPALTADLISCNPGRQAISAYLAIVQIRFVNKHYLKVTVSWLYFFPTVVRTCSPELKTAYCHFKVTYKYFCYAKCILRPTDLELLRF